MSATLSDSLCPDWAALIAVRDRDPLADPPGWNAARAHLAACRSCREAAFAADPLLVFATGEAGGAAGAPAGLPEISDAVFALVRASRVAPSSAEPAADPARQRRGIQALRGVSALRVAAALLVGSLAMLSGNAPSVSGDAPAGVAIAMSPLAGAAVVPASVDIALPPIEEIDSPDARVYDLSRADVAVVMIVDSGLDV